MSALGCCGCVAFYAICMAFKGWSLSLLICAGKAVDKSSLRNASVRLRVYRPKPSTTLTLTLRAPPINKYLFVGVT